MSSLISIYHSMEYGAVSDDLSLVKTWLSKHNNKFGAFFDNEYRFDDTDCTRTSYESFHLQFCGSRNDKHASCVYESAKKAFTEWNDLNCQDRARHLYSIARHIQKNSTLLTLVGMLDRFTKRKFNNFVTQLVRTFYYYAGWAQIMDMELQDVKPLGVVHIQHNSSYGMPSFASKVAPALAAGNSVIIQPNENTLFAFLFAEICAMAGLPPGLINVDPYFCNYKSFDMKCIFTETLRKSSNGRCEENLFHDVTNEYRGKMVSIVYESADIDSAVAGIVDSMWVNETSVTGTGSALLVQQPIYDELLKKLEIKMDNLRLGKWTDNNADMPHSVALCDSDLVGVKGESEYLDKDAKAHQRHNLMSPRLITSQDITSGIDFDEIWWPTMLVLPFRTSKEAINICNNTVKEFDVSIYSEKLPLAIEVAKSIKASTIWINCSKMMDAAASTSDFKQQGVGNIGGKEEIYEFVRPEWQNEVKFPKDLKFHLESFGLNYLSKEPLNEGIVKLDNDSRSIDATFKLYYGGAQKRPDSGYYRTIKDSDGVKLAETPQANRKDVRNAVEAALKCQHSWEKRSGFNRSQILYYLAENLDQRKEEMATHLTKHSSVGTTEAEKEVQGAIDILFYWAAYADKYGGSVLETPMPGMVLKLHQAVGVIGIVCPEEKPLLAFVSLFAPAVARGNAVVIVPSEKCPTPALKFYQLLETSDVPGGVINILSGNSDHLTKCLTEHNDVQSLWYFGTVEGSFYVYSASGKYFKRSWTSHQKRDWFNSKQVRGYEFLYECTRIKNVWMPMGETFAN